MDLKNIIKNLLKKNKTLYNFYQESKFEILLQIENLQNKYYKLKLKKYVLRYKNYKKNREPKGVIYTCIVGNYDTIKSHKYINFNWDYICFTDNERIESDGIWEIKPLVFDELDNSKNNRWHKLNPHLFLQKYKKSLYIDGNIRILSKQFFDNLEKMNNEIFISAIHNSRSCLYEEAKICEKQNLEKKETIKKQIDFIKSQNFPKNYGLYEANILYRCHNNEKIKKMSEDWWYFVKNFARRDQLSLTYVCWKNDIPFKTFSDKSFRFKNEQIEITLHRKRRKI